MNPLSTALRGILNKNSEIVCHFSQHVLCRPGWNTSPEYKCQVIGWSQHFILKKRFLYITKASRRPGWSCFWRTKWETGGVGEVVSKLPQIGHLGEGQAYIFESVLEVARGGQAMWVMQAMKSLALWVMVVIRDASCFCLSGDSGRRMFWWLPRFIAGKGWHLMHSCVDVLCLKVLRGLRSEVFLGISRVTSGFDAGKGLSQTAFGGFQVEFFLVTFEICQ